MLCEFYIAVLLSAAVLAADVSPNTAYNFAEHVKNHKKQRNADFCECDAMTCPTKCIEYKPCAMCQQWQTGPYNESRCDECPFKVIPVDELPELNETTSCQFVDPADDCTFYYLYFHDENTDKATVWVKRHKDCPSSYIETILVMYLGIGGGILFAAILVRLLHKLVDYACLHDRHCYYLEQPLMKSWHQAAQECIDRNLASGCKLGFGSGDAVGSFMYCLGDAYKSGQIKDIICVPSSYEKRWYLINAGLPVSDLDATPELDAYIEGVDEVDSRLVCIKGGIDCRVQQKMLQNAAKKFFVITDSSKKSTTLGEHYNHVPIQLVGGSVKLRMEEKKETKPVLTESKNYIIDWEFDKSIEYDWPATQRSLLCMPGVVETGLFVNVNKVYCAYPDGSVKELANE